MYYLVVNSLCRSTESVVAMAPEVRGCLTAAEPQYPPLHVELFAFRDGSSNEELQRGTLLELRALLLLPHGFCVGDPISHLLNSGVNAH